MIVTAEDFATLHEACVALEQAGVPYVIGGGTVVTIFGRNRRTKDFDVFLNREVLRKAMNVLSLANFTTTDTEKNWLYKAWRGETLVDLIVESRGGVRIDDETLSHAHYVEQHGFTFRVMGPEDLLYRKILTLTEGRPDWYDALSVVQLQQGKLDWTYFLYRAANHPRRILSFLLFAQTELHPPPGRGLTAQDHCLFQGGDEGPVPQWVVFRLVEEVWLRSRRAAANPRVLDYLRKAA